MITIQQIRQELDSEEPQYSVIAKEFGADALDHLLILVGDKDPMIASKAVYLASKISGRRSVEVLMAGARSPERVVRIAAASGARNLPFDARSAVLLALLSDHDAGVRRVALKSSPGSTASVEVLQTATEGMPPVSRNEQDTCVREATAELLTSVTSNVQVLRHQGGSVPLINRQVAALYEEIRERAYRLFESRGGLHGHDREDWVEAERSLILAPPAEILEKENEYTVRISVPGFEPSQIRVSVLPNAIIVHTGNPLSGFINSRLLRHVDLPMEVSTYTAKATLKDGLLRIFVRKLTQASRSRVAGA